MYEPDPKQVVDDMMSEGGTGDDPGAGDDLEQAMADLGDALAKKDWKAAASAFRNALALADKDVGEG